MASVAVAVAAVAAAMMVVVAMVAVGAAVDNGPRKARTERIERQRRLPL
jgi:hypothetical protein